MLPLGWPLDLSTMCPLWRWKGRRVHSNWFGCGDGWSAPAREAEPIQRAFILPQDGGTWLHAHCATLTVVRWLCSRWLGLAWARGVLIHAGDLTYIHCANMTGEWNDAALQVCVAPQSRALSLSHPVRFCIRSAALQWSRSCELLHSVSQVQST